MPVVIRYVTGFWIVRARQGSNLQPEGYDSTALSS
jgi:hypothetical protein